MAGSPGAGGTLDHQARWTPAGRWRGLSTLAPWKRNQWLPDTRDSGIGTGEIRGPGLTGASGIPDARRMASSDGVVASTPMSEELNWACGGQVSRYSPIIEGQPWRPQGITSLLLFGKRGLIRAGGGGGSASGISDTCSYTDPGGGGMAAPTRTNKPVWVSPVVNP